MAKKSYRVMAPDRFLTLRDAAPATVTVRLDGDVLACSARAVGLIEGGGDEVLYVPLEDVDAARLEASTQRYLCRWKGAATYRHVRHGDALLENVVWGYPAAPDALAALRDRVAFDPTTFTIDVEPNDAIDTEPGDGTAGSPC